MKMVARTFAIVLCVTASVGLIGCEEKIVPPSSGFKVRSVEVVQLTGIAPFNVPLSGVFVSGTWVRDTSVAAVGWTTAFGKTTGANGEFEVLDGRLPALWDSGVIDTHSPPVCLPNVAQFNVTFENRAITWYCPHVLTVADPQFSLASSLPLALTVVASGFSTVNGPPFLNLYGRDELFISSTLANTVPPNGTSATFPFPKQASGIPLGPGVYGFNVWNPDPTVQPQFLGGGFLSVGAQDTSQSTPFAIDAVDVTVQVVNCTPPPCTPRTICTAALCRTSTKKTAYPVLTLASTGQVYFQGRSIFVGSRPVALKAYKVQHLVTDSTPDLTVITTQPTRALVANYSSNSVSVVDLVNFATLADILVGVQPAAVMIRPDETKAYVANYGSATLSEVDLGTLSQSRVANVGPLPSALAMDSGGTALWVGGQGYISKIDLVSLGILARIPVDGLVTSLAVSAQQNEIVYTLVSNPSFSAPGQFVVGSKSTFAVQELNIGTGTVKGSYAAASAGGYQLVLSDPVLPASLLASGALVSANYGNSIAVAGTPTGFVLLDLVNHRQIMQGSTPSPVRGIATNPSQGILYFTAPDSNSLITIPLPPAI